MQWIRHAWPAARTDCAVLELHRLIGIAPSPKEKPPCTMHCMCFQSFRPIPRPWAPRPKFEMGHHTLTAVRDCLFNIVTATLPIWRPSIPSVVTRGPPNMVAYRTRKFTFVCITIQWIGMAQFLLRRTTCWTKCKSVPTSWLEAVPTFGSHCTCHFRVTVRQICRSCSGNKLMYGPSGGIMRSGRPIHN
jgi:hypothetical protein